MTGMRNFFMLYFMNFVNIQYFCIFVLSLEGQIFRCIRLDIGVYYNSAMLVLNKVNPYCFLFLLVIVHCGCLRSHFHGIYETITYSPVVCCLVGTKMWLILHAEEFQFINTNLGST